MPESIALPVFITVVGSAISGVLGAMFVWWRKSAVEEATSRARDERMQAELEHFRRETEKLFTKGEQVMNGFGQRIDSAIERQGKLWTTMYGPTDRNGVHGDVKALVQSMAALSAKVAELSSNYGALETRVASHGHELHGIGRRLQREE